MRTDTQLPDAMITEAVDVLRHGGVVVYPTDTVYGLGADATNELAVERVRRLKGRESTKPILALVADEAMLEAYAHVTPLARALLQEFLPGPLALVLETHDEHLAAIRDPDGSVGIRMPDYVPARELARQLGRPITSTSVNRAGMPQARKVVHMLNDLDQSREDVAYVLDIGILPSRSPSTIVDARGARVVIRREGAIPREALGAFL